MQIVGVVDKHGNASATLRNNCLAGWDEVPGFLINIVFACT